MVTKVCCEIQKHIPQELYDLCLNRVGSYAASCNKSLIQDHIELDPAETDSINNWLRSINLPKLGYAVIFQKKDIDDDINDFIHVDYNGDYDELSKVAVNIPILNCRNTVMTWYNGQYSTRLRYANKEGDISDILNQEYNIPFVSLSWQTIPQLIYTYELTNNAFIARVDIPHSVTASNNSRIVLSLRLYGNPGLADCIKRMKECNDKFEFF